MLRIAEVEMYHNTHKIYPQLLDFYSPPQSKEYPASNCNDGDVNTFCSNECAPSNDKSCPKTILEIDTYDCIFDELVITIVPGFESNSMGAIVSLLSGVKVLTRTVLREFLTVHMLRYSDLLPYFEPLSDEVSRVIFPYGSAVLVHANHVPGTCSYWRRVEKRLWEVCTFALFRRAITPQTTVLDVGAWIGPTSLFGANLAHRVVAFEPDPTAFNILKANVALNTHLNITVLQNCLSSKEGRVNMASATGGNSMSMITQAGEQPMDVQGMPMSHSFQAHCVTLEYVVSSLQLDPPYFLKMDIEGHEGEALPALAPWIAKNKPTLLVSMHLHVKTFSVDELVGIADTLNACPFLYEVDSSFRRYDGSRPSDCVQRIITLLPGQICMGCDYFCSFNDDIMR
jgi:FkbM family methyltransferase